MNNKPKKIGVQGIMRMQGSLLIILLWGLSCSISPDAAVKEANVMSLDRPWHEHTLESIGKTVDLHFIRDHGIKFYNTKEACVALEVEADSELKKAYDESRNKPHNADKYRKFLTELSKAKVLCLSRYQDNRNKYMGRRNYRKIKHNMFSYFDGTTSHRVNCHKHTKHPSFDCRDSDKKVVYKDPHNLKLIKGSVRKTLTDVGYGYDPKRKMLGIHNYLLTRTQKAFNASRSWEKDEYKFLSVVVDGNQQKRLVKVIHNKDLVSKKTGNPILPECEVSESNGAINVTGFQEVNECLDEISPWQGFCKFWHSNKKKNILNNKKINACKLQGRGMLIKEDNDNLLRVSFCEYQRAAQHFYCSGKLEYTDPQYKVYFERYGVELPRRQNSPDCPEEQTLISAHGGGDFEWDETTTSSASETVRNRFINVIDYGRNKSKNICIAIDIEPDSALMKARQDYKTKKGNQYLDEYLRQVSLAKVLCVAKYRSHPRDAYNSKKRYMYSYYTGGSDGEDHRAVCWRKNKDGEGFVCRGEDEKTHVLISEADVKAKFANKNVGYQIARVTDYDENKKMLRVRGRHLASKQKEFYPYSSKEQPEFDYIDVLVDNREQRRYVQVIETIKSRKDYKDVLPLCQGSGKNITGFEEKKVCKSEFGPFSYYCDERKNETVNICKMEKGRGVLIKKDNGKILRVVSCEYQSAANHFYCSGRIDKLGKIKVYFERYGVYAKKVNIATVHRCPDTNSKVNDANGNEVPPETIVEPPAQTNQEPQTPEITTPEITPPSCADEERVGNNGCVCNLPITHGGLCLDNCPDGYEQDGTGCQAVTTPVTPTETSPPPVSIPDCGHGDRALDSSDQTVCNCSLTIVDDYCCNSGQKVLNGLCCDSEQILVDNQCADQISPCENEMSTANGCSCDGTVYNGKCYHNGCPEGTEDDNNGGCTPVSNACSVGANADSCACNPPMKMIHSHCCNEEHNIYNNTDGCKTCELPNTDSNGCIDMSLSIQD